MFANLIQLFTRTTEMPETYDLAFVKDVSVTPPAEPRNRHLEGRLVLGWVAIIVKCVAVGWLVSHYHVPINAWWIIGPTLAMAAACTGIYVWRR